MFYRDTSCLVSSIVLLSSLLRFVVVVQCPCCLLVLTARNLFPSHEIFCARLRVSSGNIKTKFEHFRQPT